MTQESKWLPAQLTFGPAFMLLGLLHARFGPIMGWFDWVNGGVAVMGTFMMVRGLGFLLTASRANAGELAALRKQLNNLSSQPPQP